MLNVRRHGLPAHVGGGVSRERGAQRADNRCRGLATGVAARAHGAVDAARAAQRAAPRQRVPFLAAHLSAFLNCRQPHRQQRSRRAVPLPAAAAGGGARDELRQRLPPAQLVLDELRLRLTARQLCFLVFFFLATLHDVQQQRLLPGRSDSREDRSDKGSVGLGGPENTKPRLAHRTTREGDRGPHCYVSEPTRLG